MQPQTALKSVDRGLLIVFLVRNAEACVNDLPGTLLLFKNHLYEEHIQTERTGRPGYRGRGWQIPELLRQLVTDGITSP